jgi:hypothetical protein
MLVDEIVQGTDDIRSCVSALFTLLDFVEEIVYLLV